MSLLLINYGFLMKTKVLLTATAHLTIFTVHVLITRIVAKIVSDTGGNILFIWKILPTIFAFFLIPIVVLLFGKFGKSNKCAMIIIYDLLFSMVGLVWFVFYINNILFSMG
jgi:hypothetical protein